MACRAWQRWGRLRGYENLEGWLRLVVDRLATDSWLVGDRA
jgi:RNA polymerase sigma-70 factor (ECF subfamily)